MMTAGRIRKLVFAFGAARLALGAAIPVAAVWLWRTVPQAPHLSRASLPAGPQEPPAPAATRDLAWYAPLWRRDLAQDPVPRPQPAAPAPAPASPVPALLATFVSAGGSYAHLRGQDGRSLLVGLRNHVDGFELTDIQPGRVHLRRGADDVWIEMPRPAVAELAGSK